MTSLKSIIITVPKGVTKASPLSIANVKYASLLNNNAKNNKIMSVLDDDAMSDTSSLAEPDVCFRGKKRRLDHLSWEEKVQRKKLKNRVAAQTSRDRKKAKLDELEETARILRDQNELFAKECALLRTQNKTLLAENTKLKSDLESRTSKEQLCSSCQNRVGSITPLHGSTVSATNPLPKGGVTKLALALTLTPPAATLWKILTLYLLSKNYFLTSKEMITSNDLKSWPKAFCEKLPPKWKEILISQVNKSASQMVPPKNLAVKEEWWGRHQKMWRPIELIEA